MVNYQNGKIYKIVLDESDQVYVGSTTRTLAQRMANHRSRAKAGMALPPVHRFINDHGWDKAHIVLVEDWPCERKEQLDARERHWIEQIGSLNKYIPGRTREEYYQQNRVELIGRRKEYYQQNRDEVCEQMRQYYQQNRDEVRERQLHYREQNRERAREYARQYRALKKAQKDAQ